MAPKAGAALEVGQVAVEDALRAPVAQLFLDLEGQLIVVSSRLVATLSGLEQRVIRHAVPHSV